METSNVDSACQPKLLDFSQISGAFSFQEGFSRPDWKVIRAAIDQTVSPEDLGDAWTEAAVQWVLQLRADLGEQYHVRRSKEFILLSDLDTSAADRILAFAEATLEDIYGSLKDAAWRGGYGQHVILLFSDDDDYYQYMSFFCEEGTHPTSGGCLIHQDYVHIAMPYGDGRTIRSTLAHELAHNCVVHLRLPLWLNEGLAVLFQKTASDMRYPILDRELTDRHSAFWNPSTIQKFWSGVSFREPGESNALSYSLAEILVKLLLSQNGAFGDFVKQARWDDAGQTAALDCLGADLGQVAGTFLGEGNWRPQRKRMVECWEATKKVKATRTDGESADCPQPECD
jgi:hypothetical protein